MVFQRENLDVLLLKETKCYFYILITLKCIPQLDGGIYVIFNKLEGSNSFVNGR